MWFLYTNLFVDFLPQNHIHKHLYTRNYVLTVSLAWKKESNETLNFIVIGKDIKKYFYCISEVSLNTEPIEFSLFTKLDIAQRMV